MSWKIREVSKQNKEIYLIITKHWCCGVSDLMDVITKDPDLKAVQIKCKKCKIIDFDQ